MQIQIQYREISNEERKLIVKMMVCSDCTMKILMLGNSGAGKSCLLMRFIDNKFVHNYYNTIGVDYKIKTLPIDAYLVKMQVWDTAGQDRFKNITSSYFRGADGIIIVFDITDRLSYEGVQGWLTEIEKYTDPSIKILLVGNKSDLNERRQVSSVEAKIFFEKLQLPYLQTSARDGTNVEQAYLQIGKMILDRKKSLKLIKKESNENKLKVAQQKKEEKGCC